MSPFVLVVGIIGLALIFDYINGFHDAANSIATVVSTRVLRPGVAVVWAAIFNFLAAYLLGTGVAATIGSGFVNVHLMTPWVIAASSIAIGLGTMSGGWRIVRTMGTRLTRLQPRSGFCAETGAAISILFATYLGLPVSSTHAIAGVGSIQRTRAVRWHVAGGIVTAWVLTIPASAIVAAIVYYGIRLFVPGG